MMSNSTFCIRHARPQSRGCSLHLSGSAIPLAVRSSIRSSHYCRAEHRTSCRHTWTAGHHADCLPSPSHRKAALVSVHEGLSHDSGSVLSTCRAAHHAQNSPKRIMPPPSASHRANSASAASALISSPNTSQPAVNSARSRRRSWSLSMASNLCHMLLKYTM